MKLLYRRCAGIGIHRKSISVYIRRRIAGKKEAEVGEAVCGTFTQELERLARWLKEGKVRQVAMESTGVYGIPVWNILEKYKFELILVNPAIQQDRNRVINPNRQTAGDGQHQARFGFFPHRGQEWAGDFRPAGGGEHGRRAHGRQSTGPAENQNAGIGSGAGGADP